MKLKKILISSLPLTLLAGGLVATSLSVISCSKSSSQQSNSNASTQSILDTNQKYVDNESNFLQDNAGGYPTFDPLAPELAFEELIANAEQAIVALENLKTSNNFDLNQTIWLDSYIFQWQNKIENIKSGIIFLGANPITGSRILSSSQNWVRDYIKSAINIYPLNPETGDPDTSSVPEKNLVQNLATSINGAVDIVNNIKNYMQYGADNYGFMPSTVAKKYLINQLLTTFYLNEIDAFALSSNSTIDIEQLVNTTTKNTYFSELISTINGIDYLSKSQKNEIKNALSLLKDTLDNFMIWYCGEYYSHPSSFGPVNTTPITLTKSGNDSGAEKIIIASDGTKIYGAEITSSDLNQNNVGIGFMNVHDWNGLAGNDIYQQMLNNNNSINTPATEIYQKGVDFTQNFKANMNSVVNLAKELINGGLSGTIWYDADGIGPDEATQVLLAGSDDFTKFNMWLNQEDFFWGREHFAFEDELQAYINQYWNNPSTDELRNYKSIIIQQGYQGPWTNALTINGLETGTVTGNQALAGGVASLQDYIGFKDATDALYDNMFNPIKDYVISPYEYSIREDIGVGMEGPRGSCQFQYNSDPYYSLPKWSVSSLTTHEGKMGHHTQQEYWTEYLDKNGPGYTFVNDAYHEGWAVFTEWYANELGVYGSDLDPDTRMPTDWLHAKGLVPNYDENNVANLTTTMQQLHGGVYYEKVVGEEGSDAKLQNSIKLANMLQYYGFLNEAQLRNMRLCLDTAYHHKATSGETSDTSLPYGASIKQVRDYMKTNSALGIGDINSESVRYLAQPSQATGYMLGKIIFEDLYRAVEQKLNVSLATNATESRKLFDLMLRNGEIPLEVLQSVVIQQYYLDGYNWLKKVTSEIPKRKAGNAYNTDALYAAKKGERYAADWIMNQLADMGYIQYSNTNDIANTLPATISYNENRVAYNTLDTQQKLEYTTFNGFYKTQFYWKNRSGNLVDQKSQNVVVNINSSNPQAKDFYIASHYDTKNSENYLPDNNYGGNDATNDNSSGIATNLAIAQYFSIPQNRDKLDVNLHLLFAGAEEEGVCGTWAWASQFLANDNNISSNIIGMLNLDSVAGGDYIYVHSPWTKLGSETNTSGNTSPVIRDAMHNQNSSLNIHPYIVADNIPANEVYLEGETGDWSDHTPFYKNNVPIAYIETTNFLIRGENGYDGYSQVTNEYYWKKKDDSTINLIEREVVDGSGKILTIFEPENYDELIQSGDIDSLGEIWHYNWDNFEIFEKNFPGRLKTQMATVFQAIINFILTLPNKIS